jgi:hypothetical protein
MEGALTNRRGRRETQWGRARAPKLCEPLRPLRLVRLIHNSQPGARSTSGFSGLLLVRDFHCALRLETRRG